jgi:hypothetical protein
VTAIVDARAELEAEIVDDPASQARLPQLVARLERLAAMT